ncbi:MAG TPA: MmgE/PrpD family protein, partial [Vicinamibacterales bacterium]|nr:MmgE/PrpD family protein [Vicinamibacterales bacterium]
MSDITTTIAEFATSSRFSDLPESIRRDVSLRVLDTFGCALDALSSETARVARAGVFALGPGTTDGATVIGSVERLDADRAAFANGVAATCFDFNDVYVSRLGSG